MEPVATDSELIRIYVDDEDRQAFAQLVGRHIHWVNSMARRLVRDSAMADDVTQAVFVLLARKARSLRHEITLSTWLFTVTRYCASSMLRNEIRRRKHERQAAAMRSTQIESGEPTWEQLWPMLDEMVGQLRTSDRQAVLMRFYEKMTFPQIGQALQISEEAARKRVERAVDQLRESFARKGVATGAGALAATLGANVTHPASAAVIGAASAAQGGVAVGSVAKSVGLIMTLMSLKPAAAIVLTVMLTAAAATTLLQVSQPTPTVTAAPAIAPVAVFPVRYGRIVGSDEKPVPNARIWRLEYPTDVIGTRSGPPIVSDQNGIFGIESEFAPQLLVQADGFGLTAAQLREGTVDDPTEVQMRPPTSLRVRVVGPDKKPAAGVRMSIHSVGNRRTIWLSPQLQEQFVWTTDQDGILTIPGLPQEGGVQLLAVDDQFALPTRDQGLKLGETSVTDGGTHQLAQAAAISGRITFKDTGKPAAGVHVITASQDGSAQTFTDAQGNYRFKKVRPIEHSMALILKPELSTQYAAAAKMAIRLLPGIEMEGLDFVLEPGAIIRGRVTNKATGDPLPNIGIAVRGPAVPLDSNLLSESVITDKDGNYLVHVPPGDQYVQFPFPAPMGMLEPRPSSYKPTVAVGETVTLDFAVPVNPTPAVKGRAVSVDGQPISGASILLTRESGNEGAEGIARATTDSAGNFTIPAVPNGMFIRARKGRWTTVQPVVVGANRDNVNLVLHPNAQSTIRIQLKEQDGKPAGRVKVQLMAGTSSKEAINYVDEKYSVDGVCQFKSLAPDVVYGLRVISDAYGSSRVETLNVEPGKTTEVSPIMLVKADSFVGGIVLDSNGQPVEGLEAYLIGEKTGTRYARTDINGRFRIDGVVAGEQVSVSVDDRRGVPQTAVAGTDNVVLNLKPEAR